MYVKLNGVLAGYILRIHTWFTALTLKEIESNCLFTLTQYQFIKLNLNDG
jgi:hypothetical protein